MGRRDMHGMSPILSETVSLVTRKQNIGILRMTGEVTDRFDEITIFGMALFWQKATEFFTKLLQNL